MLTIDLYREIPEQQKPRAIAINQSVNWLKMGKNVAIVLFKQ
jgi:hypothetical protein